MFHSFSFVLLASSYTYTLPTTFHVLLVLSIYAPCVAHTCLYYGLHHMCDCIVVTYID